MNAKKKNDNPKPAGGAPERPVLIKPGKKRTLFARLRTYFLTGIVVSAPVGITIWLIWLFVAFVDRTVVPIIPEAYNPSDVLGVSVPGIGVIVVLIVVTMIGFLVTNFFGRFFVRMGENMVSRVPVVRTIYGVLKQIFDAVLAQSEGAFREVVLIEYPRKGIWVLGFITSATQGEVQRVTPEEMVNVFLPTTPNPTSGFLLFVPRKDCITLHMTVEEGVKLVISGGIVSPPDRDKMSAGAEAETESVAEEHQAERK